MVRIATLADKLAAEAEMPVEDRWTARTLYEQLGETAGRFPERPAVTFQLRSGPKDKAVTLDWAAFRAEVTRAANLFRRLGIGPGDTVAYLLPNGIEAAVALIAGATAGIVAPVNPLLAPEHVAGILRDTGAKVVVTLAPFPKTDLAQKVAEAVALAPERRDRARGRPHALPRAAAQMDRAADPPEAQADPPRARPRLRPRHGRRERRGARLRRGGRRPGLRLFPHRRHHRPAEGGAAPRQRHPLQRLVRQVLHLHRGGRAHVPAAALPRLRRLPDPDVLPDDRGAARHADAAGLPRRGGHGQLLEADRPAPGHLPHHRPDRGRGADAAQGRRRRLQPAPRHQRLRRHAGRALPPLRGGRSRRNCARPSPRR